MVFYAILDYLLNSFWFVFSAYVAVALPWMGHSKEDFISSEWRSVRYTRQVGVFTIVWCFFPAVYVVFYGLLQGIYGDYKEACAAMVAASFTFWHIVRTIWGLWQLGEFTRWAENAILALEAIGIKYTLPPCHEGLAELYAPDGLQRGEEMTLKPGDIADCIMINEKIIDCYILHSTVPFFIRFGDLDVLRRDEYSHLLLHLVAGWRWARIVHAVISEVILRLRGRTSGRELEQIPVRPVELWVYWGTTFATQGVCEWIHSFNDVHGQRTHVGNSSARATARLSQCGRCFAKEVLASPSERMRPQISSAKSDLNPFRWNVWAGSYDMTAIMKQELLKKAVSNCEILPYETSHLVEMTGSEDPPESFVYRYSPYSEVLRQFKMRMPVKSVYMDEVRQFDPNALEWLLIMIDMGNDERKLKAETASCSLTEEGPARTRLVSTWRTYYLAQRFF